MGTRAVASAAEVVAALRRHYTQATQGRPGERWVCIEEARAGAGFDGNQGRCDLLAIDTWPSSGFELVGHEVKVTVSDWHAELNKPGKAERFTRHCRRWYIVVPESLGARIAHEIPVGWGLLAMSPSGDIAEALPARPRPDAEPVPASWWVGWLAQIDRQHKRHQTALVQEALEVERRALHTERQEITRRYHQVLAHARDLHTQLHPPDPNSPDQLTLDLRGSREPVL